MFVVSDSAFKHKWGYHSMRIIQKTENKTAKEKIKSTKIASQPEERQESPLAVLLPMEYLAMHTTVSQR